MAPADEESAQKPRCSARCKGVVFGLFLCTTMCVFGFIIMIVGGARENTALVILGVVFFIGSFVFLFIIGWTNYELKRIKEKCCAMLCCAETVEEKYKDDDDDHGHAQTTSSSVQHQTTTSRDNDANNGAFFLDPGEGSTDDKTETFELK